MKLKPLLSVTLFYLVGCQPPADTTEARNGTVPVVTDQQQSANAIEDSEIAIRALRPNPKVTIHSADNSHFVVICDPAHAKTVSDAIANATPLSIIDIKMLAGTFDNHKTVTLLDESGNVTATWKVSGGFLKDQKGEEFLIQDDAFFDFIPKQNGDAG